MSKPMIERGGLEEFAELAIAEAFKAHESLAKNRPSYRLPQPPVFRKIIKECFWTSLLQEEGRNAKFKILFCEPAQLEFLVKNASGFGNYYEFQKPVEGTTTEILKAATAISYSRSIICITTDRRGKKLLIHGLLNIGFFREKYFLKDASQTGIVPDCLILASNAPGRLVIHLGDQGIIGFDRGIGFLRNIDLSTSPVLRNEFLQIINDFNLPGTGSRQESLIDAYIKMIDEIIFDIFLKRHGGILLLIPDREIPAAMNDLKLRNSLKQTGIWDKFSAILSLGGSLFVNNMPIQERLRLFHSSLGENAAKQAAFSEFIEVIRQIREFADFVASLSQVDGAVVLSTRLNIIGYGAEIRVNDRKLPPTFLQTVDQREQIDPLIYGTRHRSTIRFCRKFPGTMGFIFSQDGGIKAVKGNKSQVTVFPEINRMLYDFFV